MTYFLFETQRPKGSNAQALPTKVYENKSDAQALLAAEVAYHSDLSFALSNTDLEYFMAVVMDEDGNIMPGLMRSWKRVKEEPVTEVSADKGLI